MELLIIDLDEDLGNAAYADIRTNHEGKKWALLDGPFHIVEQLKVYMVTEGSDHEGASVHGIFSTREKAEAYKATMPPNLFHWDHRDGRGVQTHDMDQIIEVTVDVPEPRGGWLI